LLLHTHHPCPRPSFFFPSAAPAPSLPARCLHRLRQPGAQPATAPTSTAGGRVGPFRRRQAGHRLAPLRIRADLLRRRVMPAANCLRLDSTPSLFVPPSSRRPSSMLHLQRPRHTKPLVGSCPCLHNGTAALSGTARRAAVPRTVVPLRVPTRRPVWPPISTTLGSLETQHHGEDFVLGSHRIGHEDQLRFKKCLMSNASTG
jgi:hypothetical protein